MVCLLVALNGASFGSPKWFLLVALNGMSFGSSKWYVFW